MRPRCKLRGFRQRETRQISDRYSCDGLCAGICCLAMFDRFKYGSLLRHLSKVRTLFNEFSTGTGHGGHHEQRNSFIYYCCSRHADGVRDCWSCCAGCVSEFEPRSSWHQTAAEAGPGVNASYAVYIVSQLYRSTDLL